MDQNKKALVAKWAYDCFQRMKSEKRIRSQSQLAEHMGYSGPAQVSRLLRGETEDITLQQIELLEEFFGEQAPIRGLTIPPTDNPIRRQEVASGREIMLMGLVSQSFWRQSDAPMASRDEKIFGVDKARYPIADQAAYILNGVPDPKFGFRQGATLIAVDYSKYRNAPQNEDDLIRKVTHGDLVSYQLIVCRDDELYNVLTGDVADEEGEFVGLIIEDRNTRSVG